MTEGGWENEFIGKGRDETMGANRKFYKTIQSISIYAVVEKGEKIRIQRISFIMELVSNRP